MKIIMQQLVMLVSLLMPKGRVLAYTNPCPQRNLILDQNESSKCPLNAQRTKLQTKFQKRKFFSILNSKPKHKCNICPDEHEEESKELDRREAAFAMIGSLWSVGVIPSAIMPTMFQNPEIAKAAYGDDARMVVPNIVDNMSDRVNKQCLVESLGNRDCLVYLDPENKLYRGADSEVLLARFSTASEALTVIPGLVTEKKWSKILGVITGPLGTLGTTMDAISKISNINSKTNTLIDLEKKIKNDLYAIAAAAEKKSGDKVLEFHKKCTDHIVEYAQALSN